MSTRDIQGHVEDLYEVSISPELVSRITDTVADAVTAWQSRPLDAVYTILFLDALLVKILRQRQHQEQGDLPGPGRQVRTATRNC